MATWIPPTFEILYQNPDGSWTSSALKSHNEAEVFKLCYLTGTLVEYGWDY